LLESHDFSADRCLEYYADRISLAREYCQFSPSTFEEDILDEIDPTDYSDDEGTLH
jgi:hypothetical protein